MLCKQNVVYKNYTDMQKTITSLIVVPKSHVNPLRSHITKTLKDAPHTKEFLLLNGSSDVERALAQQAVLVDHRPCLGHPHATTLVLWNSKLVHCNGSNLLKSRKKATLYNPVLTQSGHFFNHQVDLWMHHLHDQGWVVLEFNSENSHTTGTAQRLRDTLSTIHKKPLPPPTVDAFPLSGLHDEHLPPLKQYGLRGFYGLSQTPFSDHLRLAAREAFACIYSVSPEQLTCSLDAAAISKKKPPNKNWLHIDQHPSDSSLCVQGTIVVHEEGTHDWARIGQHVCWMPISRRTKNCIERMKILRTEGATSTHWAIKGLLNNPAMPTFRPAPNPNLRVYTPPSNDPMFELLVPSEHFKNDS